MARPTLNELILRNENDITSRLTGTVPLLSRAFLKILARVLAGGWDSVYGHQEFILLNMIIDKSEGEILRRWAFQWQIEIQEATFATGNVEFTGTIGAAVPLNTLLIRSDGIEYIVTTGGVIGSGGFVLLPIECTTAGTIGNAPEASMLTLSSPINLIDDNALVIGAPIEGGVDEDTDDIIKRNLINRIQNPPMGGSKNDYEVEAEKVPGVDRAFAFENQAGLGQVLGSVTVVIKGIDPIVPSPALLTDVKTKIDGPDFKPITSTNFAFAIVSRAIDYTISIRPRDSIIETSLIDNLNKQLREDARPGEKILISHIKNAISTSGVQDFVIDDITVEGQGPVSVNDNIDFTGFEYPFVSSVTFNDLLP